MDEKLLATCSPEVENALRYLEAEIDSEGDYNIYNSAAFYALDQVGSKKAERFASEFKIVGQDPDYITLEYSDRLGFLAKLVDKYIPDAWSPEAGSHPNLNYYSERFKSIQMSKGDFSMSDYNPSGPIWMLAQEGNLSNPLRNAIENFVSRFPLDEQDYGYHFAFENAAIGVIGVSEIAPDLYSEELKEITDWIVRYVDHVLTEDSDVYYPVLGYFLMALTSSPAEYPETTAELVETLVSGQSEKGYWGRRPSDTERESNGNYRFSNLYLTGVVASALIYAGHGPKMPVIEVERMLEEKERDHTKSKPEFVSTIPSTRHKTRNTEILDYAEELISDCEEILRISTLRIDMLYEQIIDRVENNSLEVRVLTSTGTASGPRSSLKRAAMNELNKRTEGGVKEDDLIHTRMLISDDQALLVSSADLTREQLHEEFNAGTFTRDSEAIDSAIELFDTMWEEAEHRGQR